MEMPSHILTVIESISLLNTSGQTIDIGNNVSNNDFIHLDLSDLTSGIYLIKIVFAEDFEVMKIIKE